MSDRDQRAQADALQDRVQRTPLRLLVSPDSYGMTLIVIAATYILSAAVHPAWGGLVVAVQMLAVWLIFRVSRASRSARSGVRAFLVAVALFLIAQLVLGLFLGNQELVKGVPLLSAMLYFLAPIAVLRDVASRRTVNVESLFGALAAYLLIGMFFAFAYRSISLIQQGPFYGVGGEGTMAQHLFFSFITLTTTGYGNLVPAQNPGQTFAVSEALMGQIFLLTAFAKIVSAWKPARFGQNPPEDAQGGMSDAS
jgi:Ion channel